MHAFMQKFVATVHLRLVQNRRLRNLVPVCLNRSWGCGVRVIVRKTDSAIRKRRSRKPLQVIGGDYASPYTVNGTTWTSIAHWRFKVEWTTRAGDRTWSIRTCASRAGCWISCSTTAFTKHTQRVLDTISDMERTRLLVLGCRLVWKSARYCTRNEESDFAKRNA